MFPLKSPRTVIPAALLLSVVVFCASSSGAQQTWYGFVDADGVVNITDTQSDPRAQAFDPQTFETMALRQVGAPHRGIAGHRTAPSKAEQAVTPLLRAAAQRHGLDLALVKAVVAVESGFRKTAKSRVGALGLMQLMPATAKDLGVNPHSPEENVEGGTRYLAGLLKMFGDERLALAAYNAGPGRVRRSGGIPNIPETIRYVGDVLRLRDHYAQQPRGVDDDAPFGAGAFNGR